MTVRGFADALALVFQAEGPYSNRSGDPGAETKFGVARGRHPEITDAEWANWTQADSAALLKIQYWDAISGDSLPYFLALPVFDMAVNQGPGLAAQTLQRALNVTIDGKIGGATIAMARISTPAALDLFMALRSLAYSRDTQFQTEGKGWLTRCYRVARIAMQP